MVDTLDPLVNNVVAKSGFSLSDITSVVNQYVVSPIAEFGLAGYVFDVEGEAAAELSSDITDHYTEDNTAIQDQIALRPEKITLKGYVGELVYSNPGAGTTSLQTLAQKLTTISAFLPTLAASAIQAQQAAAPPVTFGGVLGASSNIYGLVKNTLGALGTTKNQQNAYNYFKALWKSKTLMSIQTPWEFMTNMAIETVRAIQDEKTKFITDFSITYKRMNIAQTSTVAFSTGGTGGTVPAGGIVRQGDAAIQGQPIENLGPTAGTATSITVTDLAPL